MAHMASFSPCDRKTLAPSILYVPLMTRPNRSPTFRGTPQTARSTTVAAGSHTGLWALAADAWCFQLIAGFQENCCAVGFRYGCQVFGSLYFLVLRGGRSFLLRGLMVHQGLRFKGAVANGRACTGIPVML